MSHLSETVRLVLAILDLPKKCHSSTQTRLRELNKVGGVMEDHLLGQDSREQGAKALNELTSGSAMRQKTGRKPVMEHLSSWLRADDMSLSARLRTCPWSALCGRTKGFCTEKVFPLGVSTDLSISTHCSTGG